MPIEPRFEKPQSAKVAIACARWESLLSATMLDMCRYATNSFMKVFSPSRRATWRQSPTGTPIKQAIGQKRYEQMSEALKPCTPTNSPAVTKMLSKRLQIDKKAM